jgi:hypothetical protein
MIKASKLRSLYASLVLLSTAASAASAWGSHNTRGEPPPAAQAERSAAKAGGGWLQCLVRPGRSFRRPAPLRQPTK